MQALTCPVVEEVGGRYVVRDDMLPGGTKRRAIHAMAQSDTRELCYAGPVFGYAQVALAYYAAGAGKRATVFCAKRKALHHRTLEASNAGATVVEVAHGYLSNVQAKARVYCAETGARLLPFGLDCAEALDAISAAARGLGLSPLAVWCAAGSGTLSRALQRAWPNAIHHAVLVGKSDADTGAATVHRAPEPFERDAELPPPFASCSNYDAKVWRFFREAPPGALFWNVAR